MRAVDGAKSEILDRGVRRSSARLPQPRFGTRIRLVDRCTGCVGGESLRKIDSYLVDPASSHMLVSKIKPCMSKFILSYGETANGSLNQSRFT